MMDAMIPPQVEMLLQIKGKKGKSEAKKSPRKKKKNKRK